MRCVSSQNYKTVSTARNNEGSNVGWAERERRRSSGEESTRLFFFNYYFLINERDSLWITAYTEIIQDGLSSVNEAQTCVNVATYTRTPLHTHTDANTYMLYHKTMCEGEEGAPVK